MANILTVPESGIYFDGNTAGSSAIPTLTGNASGVAIQYDGHAGITISSSATGVDYQDRFSIEGENGRLFGVSDQVVGSVFSVNDAGGLPLIDVEVEQDFSKITLGQYGTDAIVISGSSVQVTGSNVVTEGYLSDQEYITSSDETYSTASDLLTAIKTVDGATSALDADLLDGQHGSYYLNYNNFSNTPTIPSAANNTTITLSGGTEITTTIGNFTTNQSSPETLTINHSNVSRTNTTSNASPAFGATFTVVDAVTSNARGHVTAENVKTITLPSLGTTSTTALAGNTTVNDVSEANLKSRLAALDSNDTIYIGDAGDDTTVVIRGTLQVDGSTTTVNSTTITVDDKNIELGSIASPSDSLADGGGITLKGTTDKTITWIDSTDSWTSNQNFSAPSLTLTSLSNQSTEATALMINGSNVVGTRELSTSAFVDSSEFASASHTHAAGDITSGTLNAARLPRPINGDWWNGGAVIVGTDGVMEVGKYLDFHTADSGGGTDYDVRVTASNNAISVGGSLTATSLIKFGGTSSEFLKADGSVDSSSYSTTSHNHTLDSLSNVTITSNASGEILKWNGSAWINNTLAEAGIAAAGDENIIDGALSIWNADGDGDVFDYNDSNPTHNGKYVGAVINIRGDGATDSSLVRAGLFTSDHVSTVNGYYVGSLLGTANSTTTQVINNSGEWTGAVISSAKLDADTAHLSGTQTFSGAKTFSVNPKISHTGNISFAMDKSDATTTTNLVSYVSFQAGGSEVGWVGFGSNGDSNITLRNTSGKVVLNGSSGSDLGTVVSGTWNGSIIASAYLDADTAHLSGTQTFSGAKTFSSIATFSGSETNFASGSMLDWANGDARIIEGAHGNNYSLSFQTFDGSSCSTKMHILGNGNVGIGTTSPNPHSWGQKTLTVQAAGANAYSALETYGTGTGAGAVLFGADSIMHSSVQSTNGSHLVFTTNASNSGTSQTERMRILSSGQLIVGGTAFGYSGTDLQVGNTSDSQNGLNILTSTTGYGYILFGDGLANADSYVGQISYKHGDDYMAFRTAGTEKIRITSSGEVGIGTVSPVAKLQVKGADSLNAFKVTDAGDGDGFKITSHTTQGTYVQVYDASHTQTISLDARSDNTNRHTYFNGGGNVGIGTTSPDKKLNVHSGATSDIVKFQNNNGSIVIGKTANLGSLDMASDASFRIRHGSTVSAFFKSDGNVGIGTTTPQKKLDVYLGTASAVASIGGRITVGGYAGLHFGYSEDGNSSYRKSAIVFERTDLTTNNAQGKVHILNGPQTGSGSATLSDAKLTIAENGNVGIGTTTPDYELHVIGTASFTDTVAGAYFEENASHESLKSMRTGTILVMNEDGDLVPCSKEDDMMVFGVVKKGYKQPIIMGAEPIKVTGPIKVGDFITTSNVEGHGMKADNPQFGTIIAQAMESGDGESYNIKAMIRKNVTMQVTLKYNKNTQEITLIDGDDCCEYRFALIEDTDDELSVIVMQDYNPDMLEEPINFKAQIFDEIIDTE